MNIKKIKISQLEIKKYKIETWPIWTSEVKQFDWYYDETEICYFIEGKVKVKTKFEEIEINKGDLIVFPKGLSCTWKVIEPVKKYYSFDEDLSNQLIEQK